MVTRTISFEISSVAGYSYTHPKRPFFAIEGFKITSFRHLNIVEIQFYDQNFDTTIDALGASWAGLSIFVHHRYWIGLLRTSFKQNDRPFRLRKIQAGYVIGGSCCGHSTLLSILLLEECWEGRMLLAEDHGGWR